jgi:hypothetical protein
MFVLKEARRAMIAAYRSASTQGAPHEVASDTAIARYRAFLPDASFMEARAVLAEAISTEARSDRAGVL